jgi:hypothetical protein
LPSTGKCASGRKAKKNHSHFEKSICNGSRKKLQKNSHLVPLNTEIGMSKTKPRSGKKNSISQAQFEGRSITLSPHVQANCGILAGRHHPFIERYQEPPPLSEVANIWLPHRGVSSVSCPNCPDELFNTIQHPNATPLTPPYFRQSDQQRVAFPSSGMLETVWYPHPDISYGTPHFRYPRGEGAGFRR